MLSTVHRSRGLALLPLLLALALQASAARADTVEPKDPTRLDVERLPPEAVDLQRDMFATGPYLQAMLGGRGFAGGLGRLTAPGLYARVGAGYELSDYFALGLALELSLHDSDAPAPPPPTSLQLIDSLLELRLRLPLSVRAALWLSAEAGLGSVLGNTLESYGLPDADSLGFIYGGSLGFDWHLLSPHHSLGLLAGTRLAPNLDGPGNDRTFEIHSALYLAYVF